MIRRPRSSSLRSRKSGFTLLEVTVVIVILGIMAAMVVPRLTGNDVRQFKHTVEQVGDLLTVYAQRQTLGQKVVGIFHNRRDNQLMLMSIDADSTAGEQTSGWRIDTFVQPITLPPFMRESDIAFVLDGERYDASQWPLTCKIGEDRPTIEVHLRGAGQTATLILYSYGVAPVMMSSYDTSGTVRSRVDLNATGRSREDW